MTVKRKKKLSNKLKERCKKLGIRITVKKQGKRVYKTTKALLQECKKKLKRKFKKKRKIKRRRKFGMMMMPGNNNNNNTPTTFDNYYNDIIRTDLSNNDHWRRYQVYYNIHQDQINSFIRAVQQSNNNDTKEQLEAILFMAIVLERQTLIASDILKDGKGNRLYTGKSGMKMLFDRLMFTINNNHADDKTLNFFRRLNPDFSNIVNILTNPATKLIFLKDFVSYIQTQTRTRVSSWLQTFFDSKNLSSELFERLIGRNIIISHYPKFIQPLGWDNLRDYHDSVSTLDGQLHYENYIKYKLMTSEYVLNRVELDLDNGKINDLSIRNVGTTNNLKDMKKAVQELYTENLNPSNSINIFSLIDGSHKGDTSSFNTQHVELIHNSLFVSPVINYKYFPNNFLDLSDGYFNPLKERAIPNNCKILGLRNSDFMYSLPAPPNTRIPFYLKVCKKFTICRGIPGLEGKICIAQTNPRIPGTRPDLTQHVVRDFLSMNGATAIRQGYPVVTPNTGFNPTAEGLNMHPPNHNGQGLYYVQNKNFIQEVYANELVLENEHISKWVCLKVAGTITKFKNVVLGYLNNFSINGILERNLSEIGNYQFNNNPRQPSFLPDGMLGDIIQDPTRRTWGFIKVMPQSMFGNDSLIPDQYVYQKSTISYGVLVWYITNIDNVIRYMFICNNFPTNEFINDFSKVLQYNVINNIDFQTKLLLSLWNYKRILDPLQYLGLREQTHIIRAPGVFATQDFYCFLQCLYLKITNDDKHIDIIWQKDKDSLITTTNESNQNFGTIKNKEKDIDTLIKEILDELDIEKYFDFVITILDNGKVGIKHFINPYILEQYYKNSLVKKNMDTILGKLDCTSFEVQKESYINEINNDIEKKEIDMNQIKQVQKTPRTNKRQIKATPLKGPHTNKSKLNISGKRTLFRNIIPIKKKVQTNIKKYFSPIGNNRPRSLSNVSNLSNVSSGSATSTSTIGDYYDLMGQGIVSGTIDKLREYPDILKQIEEGEEEEEEEEEEDKKKWVRQNTQQELREITGQYGKKRKKKKVRSKKKPIKKKVKKPIKKKPVKKKVKKPIKKKPVKKKVKKKRKVKKRK